MCEGKEDKLVADSSKNKSSSEEIDLSEDFGNMFGTSHNLDEVPVPMHPMLYCCQIHPCTAVKRLNWTKQLIEGHLVSIILVLFRLFNVKTKSLLGKVCLKKKDNSRSKEA